MMDRHSIDSEDEDANPSRTYRSDGSDDDTEVLRYKSIKRQSTSTSSQRASGFGLGMSLSVDNPSGSILPTKTLGKSDNRNTSSQMTFNFNRQFNSSSGTQSSNGSRKGFPDAGKSLTFLDYLGNPNQGGTTPSGSPVLKQTSLIEVNTDKESKCDSLSGRFSSSNDMESENGVYQSSSSQGQAGENSQEESVSQNNTHNPSRDRISVPRILLHIPSFTHLLIPFTPEDGLTSPPTRMTSSQTSAQETPPNEPPDAISNSPKDQQLKPPRARKNGALYRVEGYKHDASESDRSPTSFASAPGRPAFSVNKPIPESSTVIPTYKYRQNRKRAHSLLSMSVQSDEALPPIDVDAEGVPDFGSSQTSESLFGRMETDHQDTDENMEPPGSPIEQYPDRHPSMEPMRCESSEPVARLGSRAQSDETFLENPVSGASNNKILEDDVPKVFGILTINFEDTRENGLDPSYTQMGIDFTPNPEGGFYVQALDLCDILQNGPSRIFGPVRLYAFRGTRMQYFLTVTEDNQDIYDRMTLLVPANRELFVYLDYYPPPQRFTLPQSSIPSILGRTTSQPPSQPSSSSNVRNRGQSSSRSSKKQKSNPPQEPTNSHGRYRRS
ncbi:hypothetical protein PNOK_0551500 [Pyrrhoderma noxium]|uniref:Uncharacterized protein n=1 Tax=Pyrrhoderma noxium TaxID=2282107 RepID=A0A286UGC7_9AGAM|nr:hypothetical protein PNOK_0551500 [Pyrrhoderma noxium]